MRISQYQITLNKKSRGFHIVTDEILEQLPILKNIKAGIANFFIQHTSASLAINENADPTVRLDMETFFNRTVSENNIFYKHIDEGTDDMTSHIKNTLIGCSLNIPITNGRLALGTWQGIYLCEHRNHSKQRNLVVTIMGDEIE